MSDMAAREIEQVLVANVIVGKRRRHVSDDAVVALAGSMREIGLQNPILVRYVEEAVLPDGEVLANAPVLIAGETRLRAAKSLGWEKIDAIEAKVDDIEAAMIEIAENLHRADLTALERAEQVAEWVRLAEERGQSKLSQPETVSRGGRGKEGGVRAAARELNVGKDEAHRAVKIAALAPEAKEAAIAAGLDKNQSALLDAAKAETPDAQVRVIEQKARQAEQMKAERRAKDKAARHQDVKDAKSDALETAARIIADDVRPENIPALASALALRGDRELAARIQALTGAVFDNSRLGEAA